MPYVFISEVLVYGYNRYHSGEHKLPHVPHIEPVVVISSDFHCHESLHPRIKLQNISNELVTEKAVIYM